MSQSQNPTDSYADIMGRVVDWLVDVYQRRLEQAKSELASAETILGGLGYEEKAESLAYDGLEHPTPQRSLARLAGRLGEIERELEERRSLILNQQWESMAGEYALVAVQTLTEARQYLGLAQSAVANVLVSLASNKLNAWEKQTRLYGVRLSLERVETLFVWAIESASNGLRQHHLDGGSQRLAPPPAPPRVSAGAVSYRAAPAEANPPPAAPTLPPPSATPIPPVRVDAPSPSASLPESPRPAQSAPPPASAGEAERPSLFGRLRRRKRPPTS